MAFTLRDTEQGPPRREGVVPPRVARGGSGAAAQGDLCVRQAGGHATEQVALDLRHAGEGLAQRIAQRAQGR